MITDFHSHVLPNMDDGSKSTEQSISILRKMKSSGIEHVMLTPHFYRRHEDSDSFLKRREESAYRLAEALRKEEKRDSERLQRQTGDVLFCGNPFFGIGGEESVFPTLGLGAEIAFTSRTSEEPALELLTYTGTNTLLIEMPFSPWTEFEYEALEHICLNRGFDIVLAHIERYPEVQEESEIFERISALPLKMQINAEALLPLFKRKQWISFFEDGRAHLLGSDCHGLEHRPPNLAEGRAMPLKKLGEGILAKIDEEGESLFKRR